MPLVNIQLYYHFCLLFVFLMMYNAFNLFSLRSINSESQSFQPHAYHLHVSYYAIVAKGINYEV